MTAIPTSTPSPSDVASHVLANSLTSSVVIEGPQHIVGYANRAFCRLMGKSRADLTGRPFCQLQLNMEHCSAALDRVFHSGQPEIYTQSAVAYEAADSRTYTIWPVTAGDVSTGLVIEVIDGSERHELATAINEALLLGSVRQHELTEAACLSNALLQGEIKERTLAEEQLEETQTQLIYQASELEAIVAERTAELTKSNQQLEAFIYSIAHDFRAPLRAMQGFSELMMEEAGETLNEAGRGYVERINKSAQFMDAMLIDLLEFSHVSQGQIELESVNVESIIRNVLFQMQTLIKESSGNVECVSLWSAVLAHRRTLSQVLINLITNALKFVEVGISPQIIIRAEERQDFIRIWVEDNGIGIAPNHHEQIFGVFRRLKPGKYPGTGIGLAIVQRGVERMGGQLGVNSVPNQGSRFWFELRKA